MSQCEASDRQPAVPLLSHVSDLKQDSVARLPNGRMLFQVMSEVAQLF